MHPNPWHREFLRLFGVVAGGLFLYGITQSGWVALALFGGGYLVFIGYQLNKFTLWLKADMPDDRIPESSGIIGNMIHCAYRYKKTVEKNYQHQQEAAQQFTDIISAIPSATVIIDQHQEIAWANYPALVLLGIDGQQDMGVKIDSLLRQAVFSKHLSKDDGKEFEIMSPVDPDITLVMQLVPYAEKKRLLLAHNISPHIETQRSRKTFIANASHELRTPLTVIAGYLEFIQSTPNLPDTLVLPVDKALAQSESMQVLIDDLLTLSQLENKALKATSLTRIDVKKHLSSILQTLDTGGKSTHHHIVTRIGKNTHVYASQKELDSICYNLINNALKYSEVGSKITISWEKYGTKEVKFSVSDKGVGIEPEHIAHLTERFYRVDSGRSRRVGGTGLGLSITKHCIERHHGRMEIHSRFGEGSTFSATLPINPLKA